MRCIIKIGWVVLALIKGAVMGWWRVMTDYPFFTWLPKIYKNIFERKIFFLAET
jgi:hypothetical protein